MILDNYKNTKTNQRRNNHKQAKNTTTTKHRNRTTEKRSNNKNRRGHRIRARRNKNNKKKRSPRQPKEEIRNILQKRRASATRMVRREDIGSARRETVTSNTNILRSGKNNPMCKNINREKSARNINRTTRVSKGYLRNTK